MLTCKYCKTEIVCNSAIYIGTCPKCRANLHQINDDATIIDGTIYYKGGSVTIGMEKQC